VLDRLNGTSCENFKTVLAQRCGSPLQKATAVDFMTYLVDDILVKVDRASMLASLEVRAPFLDASMIEFAFRDVPDHLKATANQRKILPRMLAERLLPKGLDLTRKQGFSLPLSSWFRGEWGQFVGDVLSSADPHIFDQRSIQRLMRGQRMGFSNTQRLFALTMFELWRRHYGVTL
jgi:asparagine synthase (glutamine-hydrolysing)